ncbi:PilN domain-containing protein [bacterium]|nr:PilN domain-containing protein [bacterium]
MIERINFIEKKPFDFTYQKILAIVGVFMAVAALLFGYQTVRFKIHEKKMASLNESIQQLQHERDRLLKAAPPKIGGGRHADLTNIFNTTPIWNELVDDITGRLPSTVWLTEFTGSVRTNTPAPSKKDKKESKPENPMEETAAPSVTRSLELKGNAKEFDNIALFLSQLSASPFIKGATLTDSKKTQDIYTFSIECDLATGSL